MNHSILRAPLALALVLAVGAAASADPRTGFDKVTLIVNQTTPASEQLSLEVKDDGTARLQRTRSRAETRNETYEGKATRAELDAIVAAFKKADLATLPATLVPANGQDAWKDVVGLTTQSGTTTRTTLMPRGSYGTHEARVAPLVKALQALAKRIGDEGSTRERAVVGKIALSGTAGGVAIVDARNRILAVKNEPFVSILNQLGTDTYVVLRARVTEDHFYDHAQVLAVDAIAGKGGAVLRLQPRAGSTEIARVAEGGRVSIVAKDGEWLLANADGRNGWVVPGSVKLGTKPPAPPAPATEPGNTRGLSGLVPR